MRLSGEFHLGHWENTWLGVSSLQGDKEKQQSYNPSIDSHFNSAQTSLTFSFIFSNCT